MPSFCDVAENFAVLPHQWIVERRLGWFMQNCRLSKDYERLCASSEALEYAAMIRLMTRRSPVFEDFSASKWTTSPITTGLRFVRTKKTNLCFTTPKSPKSRRSVKLLQSDF